MADSIDQRTTYITAHASPYLKSLAMRRSSSALGVDPESLTPRVRSRRSNKASSTSASSSQLLTQDAQPGPSEACHPSGIFAGASNVDAPNGTFNDVARDQYNIKVGMQDNDLLLLDKLPNVKHAGFQSVDHETCLTGTRSEELRRIEEWETDYTDKRIYWLNGLAGYGKSTIARTLAERSSKKGKLGASFFCSRDFEDRRNIRLIFPTLAYQLAYRYTEFKTALVQIIASDPNIGHTLPSSQLESLLVQPLKSIGLHTTIVIDALDECKEDQPASVILSLLGKYIDDIPFVKFFITGRPEPQIRSGFRLPLLRLHAEVFLLHDVDRVSVDQDIGLYVKTRLSEIVTWTDYDLPVPWPTNKEIIAIVEKSSGVFIISSIIVRFIASPLHDPQERMKLIISRPESTVHEGEFGIDATYRQVFLHSCENAYMDNNVFERLRLVIGSIVLVLNPVSCADLAVILGIPRGDVRNAAHLFHSVLIVPKSELDPMRICHKSLADFVSDANRCTDKRFHIDPSVYHMKLGMSCLRLMNEMLKRNICDLPPYAMNEDIDDLGERRAKYIGGGLEYACRSWAKHLCLVSSHGEHVGDVIKSLECFFHHKLLSWLEVLSIIGDLGSAVYSLRNVRGWLTESGHPDTSLLALVEDSERFVLRFFDAIEASVPHIYDSGLLLCPATCHVRARYQDQIQTKVKVLSAIDNSWNACYRTLQTQYSVCSVEFSHKDDLIAVGGYGCVETFEAVTGQRRAIFTLAGGKRCNALAFSLDDTVLVAGCAVGTIFVLDLQTGSLVSTLKGHAYWVMSVAFSPCGNMIASASSDHTIRIWSASTYECLCIFDTGRSDDLCWLGIGSRLILGYSSDDKTVEVWDVAGERCLKTFKFTISSIGHSRDYSLFACASWDDRKRNGTIMVIDPRTGDLIKTISTDGLVNSIRLSNQGKVMYTTHTDSTLSIHELTNTNPLTLKHDFLSGSAISSDGSFIATFAFHGFETVYRDRFVKVWQLSNISQTYDEDRPGLLVDVIGVAFSGDGQLIAWGSWDGSVKVWEATSGRCLDSTFMIDGEKGYDIDCLTLSPDSMFLAYHVRHNIRIWNIQSHTLTSTITIKGSHLANITFSPDGSQLASLLWLGLLELWEVATGDCLASIQPNDSFNSVVFGIDGYSVILESLDTGSQKRWMISPNTRNISADNDDHSPLPMTFVPVHGIQQPTSSDVPSQQVYYKKMGEWILDKQKRRVCWVLPDLRSKDCWFYGEKVVLGCHDGRVMIVDISDVRY